MISLRCQLLLLLAIAAMPIWHSATAQYEFTWESPGGPFYREGCWWAIAVELPPDFPGSRQKLVAALDRFQVSLEGRDAASGSFWGYFLISGVSPHLTLSICDDSGREMAHWHKVLQLQRLAGDESLVGIYGSDELRNALLGMPGEKRVYFHRLSKIPDCPEALQIFDLLVWDAADMDVRDMEILRTWVNGGGNLLLSNSTLLKQAPIRDWLGSFTAGQLTCVGCGLGKVFFSSERVPIPVMWPEVRQAVAKNRREKSAPVPDIFPPQSWDEKLRLSLWLWSTAIFGVGSALSFWYRRSRLIAAAVLLTVGGGCWALLREMRLYLPAEYQRLTLTRLVANQPVMVQEQYHYFRPLRQEVFSYTFCELPMPLSRQPVLMHRGKTGWTIEFSPLDEARVWRTHKVSTVLGQVGIEDLLISNETPYALDDCVYFNGEDLLSLGDFPVAKTIHLDPAPNFTHSLYNLPDSWSGQESLLSWFRQRHLHQTPKAPQAPQGFSSSCRSGDEAPQGFSSSCRSGDEAQRAQRAQGVVVGYGPPVAAEAPKFATSWQMHLMWFTLSF